MGQNLTKAWRSLIRFIARNASHFTAKRASSAFVTIERLSHKDQRPPRWSEVAAACDDLYRQAESNSELKISVVVFAPVGRFFPYLFYLALAWWLMQSFCIWRSPHSLLSCLPLSVCVPGWDVCELDDLLVVLLLLLLVYGETSSWRCWSDHVDKQAFSCLVASSGCLKIKHKMFQDRESKAGGWKSLDICLKSYSPSVVPDFQYPHWSLSLDLQTVLNQYLYFKFLRKLQQKNKFKVQRFMLLWAFCERWPDLRSHLQPRWSRRTIKHNASHSTEPACETRFGQFSCTRTPSVAG